MVGAGSYRMLLGTSQEQAQQALKADQYIVIYRYYLRDLQSASFGKSGDAKLQEVGIGRSRWA